MSNFTTLLDRNRAFAATDARTQVPEIPFIPLKQVCLITCIDPPDGAEMTHESSREKEVRLRGRVTA